MVGKDPQFSDNDSRAALRARAPAVPTNSLAFHQGKGPVILG